MPVWVPPALLALLLGSWQLGRPLLWRDELASWSAATRSPGRLWSLLDHVDAVSGLYYFLLHYWVQLFGASTFSLRLPSVLATAATAGLTAAVGKRLFGGNVGLWAGLLFAVDPIVLRYAQEARSYALADTAVLLATWQLVRLLDCREARGRRRMALGWLGYAAALVLAGLLHLIAVTVVLSHVWLLLVRRRSAWRGFVPAVTVAVLALLPLAIAGRSQSGRQINWVLKPNVLAFPGLVHDLTWGWPIAVALALLAVFACTRKDGLAYLPVPLLPIAAVWVISQFGHSYWVERYLLFTVPLYTILCGVGADRLPWRRVAAPAAIVLTAAIAAQGLMAESRIYAHNYTDWRAGAHVIAAGYRPGDAIVPERGSAALYMADLGMDYYLPHADRPRDIFAAVTAVQRGDLIAQECPAPTACLDDSPRIWVVTYGRDRNPLGNLPTAQQRALRAHYAITAVNRVKGLTVSLLVAK